MLRDNALDHNMWHPNPLRLLLTRWHDRAPAPIGAVACILTIVGCLAVASFLILFFFIVKNANTGTVWLLRVSCTVCAGSATAYCVWMCFECFWNLWQPSGGPFGHRFILLAPLLGLRGEIERCFDLPARDGPEKSPRRSTTSASGWAPMGYPTVGAAP